MIFLDKKRLEKWLDSIGKNKVWLYGRLGISKYYGSMLINNKCKIPDWFKEQLMILTNMSFEMLFIMDGIHDDRSFLNSQIYRNNVTYSNSEYKKYISSRRGIADKKNS